MVKKMTNRNDKGFTILEVMAALTFLAIGLLGIAGLHHAAIFGNQSASYMTRAVNLAEDKIEELKRLDFSNPALADTDGIDTDVGTDIKSNPSLFTIQTMKTILLIRVDQGMECGGFNTCHWTEDCNRYCGMAGKKMALCYIDNLYPK